MVRWPGVWCSAHPDEGTDGRGALPRWLFSSGSPRSAGGRNARALGQSAVCCLLGGRVLATRPAEWATCRLSALTQISALCWRVAPQPVFSWRAQASQSEWESKCPVKKVFHGQLCAHRQCVLTTPEGHALQKRKHLPWLLWPSGLSAGLGTKAHWFDSQSGHTPGLWPSPQ